MSFSRIESRVRELIVGLSGIEATFSAEADVFRELGVESAAALDLRFSSEEEFEVSIDDETFASTRSLAQMSALISKLRGVEA